MTFVLLFVLQHDKVLVHVYMVSYPDFPFKTPFLFGGMADVY